MSPTLALVVGFLFGAVVGAVGMFLVAVWVGRQSRTLRQQIGREMQQAHELGAATRKARRGGGRRAD